jgi:hypothetical protein
MVIIARKIGGSAALTLSYPTKSAINLQNGGKIKKRGSLEPSRDRKPHNNIHMVLIDTFVF